MNKCFALLGRFSCDKRISPLIDFGRSKHDCLGCCGRLTVFDGDGFGRERENDNERLVNLVNARDAVSSHLSLIDSHDVIAHGYSHGKRERERPALAVIQPDTRASRDLGRYVALVK